MSSDENRLRPPSPKQEQDFGSFILSEQGAQSFSGEQQVGEVVKECVASPPAIQKPTATSQNICAMLGTWLQFWQEKLSDRFVKYIGTVSKEKPMSDYVTTLMSENTRATEAERLRGKFGLTEPEAQNVLENAKMFMKIYARCNPPQQGQFLGITDKDGVLQSAAYYEIKYGGTMLKVEHVATAPWNLFRGDPRAVKGAGTALMQEFIRRKQQSDNQQMSLELIPTDYSEGFYTRLGFQKGGIGMIYKG